MQTTLNFKALGVLSLLAVTTFVSCDRDTPTPTGGSTRTFTPGEGFFILNEGGFNAGNSSISYYALNGTSAGNSFSNLYFNANTAPLGDVAQSISLINNRLYVVVNNSSKIEVLNPYNLELITTITGTSGPRNIVQINSTTAFVTQMYSSEIKILDLTSNSITGSIDLGVTSESIVLTNGKVFVTSQESDKLYVIDPSTNAILDSSSVIAPGGNSMCVDANGKLWVLAYGYWATSAPGGLFRINSTTNAVESSMPFTSFDFPTHLVTNPSGDSLFFLNYNVYRMSINDIILPPLGYISGTGHSFYTIGLLPNTSNTFVGDAVDYVQSGLIFRYDASGTQTDVDTVGVIPNNFLLY